MKMCADCAIGKRKARKSIFIGSPNRAPVGLSEGLIPLSAYADIPLFKGDFLKN